MILHECQTPGHIAPYRWNPELRRVEFWSARRGTWVASFGYDDVLDEIEFHRQGIEPIASYAETWAEPMGEFV